MKCTKEKYCEGDAKYRLNNGDVETDECEIHIKESLLDLVTGNRYVDFIFTEAEGSGDLPKIEIA